MLSLSIGKGGMWEAHRETAGGNGTRTASGSRRTSSLQALLLARCVTVRKSLSFSELGFLVCGVELITCARLPHMAIRRKGRE